ncbi:EAL domain-containing protein [Pseudaeromonas sp. ZJS20]|uniref:putative bifunctional diguanylate cyclase/phosphodiesterase n=1 Tax=Pseudaeromonas aegiceratis TaxID=3153928 RepID=UPI00390CC46D
MATLKRKLLWRLLPGLLLPLLALGYLTWQRIDSLSQERTQQQQSLLAATIRQQLFSELDHNQRLLQQLADSAELQGLLAAPEGTFRRPQLQALVKRRFMSLLLHDENLRQLALFDSQDRPWVRLEQETGASREDHNNIRLLNRLHSLSVPVPTQGLFLDEQRGRHLIKQAWPLASPLPGETSPGTLILTLDPQGLMLRPENLPAGAGYALLLGPGDQLVAGQTPPGWTPHGEPLPPGYDSQRIPIGLDLVLLSLSPHQGLSPQARQLRQVTLLWLGISMVALAALLSWILKRHVLQPIDALRQLMQQVMAQQTHHIPLVKADDELGELRNHFASMLSRLETSQQELEQSAFLDPLTGMGNRAAFARHLHGLAGQAQGFALTQFKLLQLSAINRTFGNRVGDEALQLFGQLLTETLRRHAGEEVARHGMARVGSDEFAFTLTERQAPQPIKLATRLCEQLAERLKLPVNLGSYELFLRFSAGIVSYPLVADNVEELMQAASQARHDAQRRHGSHWLQLDGATAARLREDKWLESELGFAIAMRQLYVVFQPQYDLQAQRICGAELLLRWQHPEFGLVPPDRFIAIAEHSGQILDIDLWVLEQACQFLARLEQARFADFRLAINASATELSNPHYPRQVELMLKRHHLSPERIGIEITETALVELDDVARSMVSTLKQIGVEIALDDFGTGYASLSHLTALPLDTLKIDRSYTVQLESNPKLVDSILQLAEAFSLSVIAEGVETPQQLRLLQEKGCDMAQGYLLARPMREEALLILLEQENKVVPIGRAGQNLPGQRH